MSAGTVVMEGYLLKKKRKKMQGMARRFFRLAGNGALSYAFNPTSPLRDSIYVSLAFISASRKHRTFHIDGGTTVYHCKALTLDDFDRWAEALKRFIPVAQVSSGDAGHSHGLAEGVRGASVGGGPAAQRDEAVEKVMDALGMLNQARQAPRSGSSVSGSSTLLSSSPTFDDAFDARGPPGGGAGAGASGSSSSHSEVLLRQLSSAVATLKHQHAQLALAVRALPALPPSSSSSPTAAAAPRATDETSTVEEGGDEDEDSDGEGEETEDEYESDREAAEKAAAARIQDEGGAEGEAEAPRAGASDLESGRDVQRRSQLPAPVSGDEFSMLSMLRKNVGKDLSTISFPVTMNEPLSALQRLAEELEYSELLDRAAQCSDPIERLTLVAVWAVSGASSNKHRSSRKPFNPLLGETYECIRPDKGFRFVSEKVSHHPPVIAFLGDAPSRGWQICGYTSPSTKFWGRSMEASDFGVRFADNNEVFTIRKPSSFVRNLVAGTKYLEVVGDLVVTTSLSSAQATIAFKEGSTWGGLSGRNKIEGKVVDASGAVAVELVGRWDEAVDKKEGKNNYTRLWQVADFPPNPERYYGFSRFAVTLNETTPIEEGLVAPTDSRLRPDQLAFERGDVDEAERLKAVVEEKQRAKRKEGKATEPRWFKKTGDDGWEYSGDYCAAILSLLFFTPPGRR
ncbi:Oxysterol-binding protein-domain-containing protein [Rhodotorula diobovata]|uniref:Oxysterol-binding protein-domain-containing protein n=1 Tax=Rhodotorula diobovata TaxID=5288 RepID=A0A5C5G0F9_9BASI|nr:Oxysterol-binding protein-domain-containing protein [Rhodotorula diobovata]